MADNSMKYYSTAEIVLVMLLVTVVLSIPTVAGAIYYFWFM